MELKLALFRFRLLAVCTWHELPSTLFPAAAKRVCSISMLDARLPILRNLIIRETDRDSVDMTINWL